MARLAKRSPSGWVPWRHSLYARGFLSVAAGGAALMVGVHWESGEIADRFVDQLLDERLQTARVAGSIMERLLSADVGHVHDVAPRVDAAIAAGDSSAAGAALAQALMGNALARGAFIIDGAANLVSVWPTHLAGKLSSIDLAPLHGAAIREGRTVASALHEALWGSVGGLLIVGARRDGDPQRVGSVGIIVSQEDIALRLVGQAADVELIDRAGRVVTSTDPHTISQVVDHREVLAHAILARQELRQRCHGCHVDPRGNRARETSIMAFVPMPTLELGMAVRQSELDAMAPSRALRVRLRWWAFGFVLLFLVFGGLSVRAVVRPVVELMQAMARAGISGPDAGLPSFGRSEVGRLAHTMERWRRRVVEARDLAEQRRRELRTKAESSESLLRSLRQVTELSLIADSVGEVLDLGVATLLSNLGYEAGAAKLSGVGDPLVVGQGIDEAYRRSLLQRVEAWLWLSAVANNDGTRRRFRYALLEATQLPPAIGRSGGGGAPLGEAGSERSSEATASSTASADAAAAPPSGRVLIGDFTSANGLRLTCALLPREGKAQIDDDDESRLQALLHHIVVSASNCLFKQEMAMRQEKRRELLRRVLGAQEDERRRLARELHDTLSQDLAAMRLHLERCAKLDTVDSLRHRAAELERRMQDMMDTVRRISLDLRPLQLDQMGFVPAMRWHLERLHADEGIRTMLNVDGDELQLSAEVTLNLFRVFQESLQNAVQHGKASQLFVSVKYAPTSVTLAVEDDGLGFDVKALFGSAARMRGMRGLGLVGIEERIHLLGGELKIESQPGEGTLLQAIVPCGASASSREAV